MLNIENIKVKRNKREESVKVQKRKILNGGKYQPEWTSERKREYTNQKERKVKKGQTLEGKL